VSDAAGSVLMTSYKVATLSLQQPQTRVRVRHYDRCVHVSRENTVSWRDLQLTVVGNRGATQLQEAVRTYLVTAVQNSTVIRSHFCVTYKVTETTEQGSEVTYGLGKRGRSSLLPRLPESPSHEHGTGT
jgi:hypothetical protein